MPGESNHTCVQGAQMTPALKLKPSGEMSVQEAAAYCGISYRTLYNRVSDGEGPRHLKRFGRLVFLSSDLDQWIKDKTKIIKPARVLR